ncbi:MAG: thioredoxin-dependent thiol peroxidase [bacterium]
MLGVGDPAPDFSLPDQHGETVRLADLRGETVVLYFYPRADTPGCTRQACGVRDRSSEYRSAGARVIGVSPDEVPAVERFAGKCSLDFTLLADADHAVADAYGIWVQKSMYGKRYWGVQRATFVISAEGMIAKVFEKVSPKTHDDDVLGALAELNNALGSYS